MKNRAVALALAIVALLLNSPGLEATMPKTGGYPLRAGILSEDDSCPAATHSLSDVCTHQRTFYIAFHRMKGVKRFTGSANGVLIFGPSDGGAACGLPVVEAKYIYEAVQGPGPCPP